MRTDKLTKHYLSTKYDASLFSKDPDRQVGARLLAPGSLQTLSTGYNGMARGIDETCSHRWARSEKDLWMAHAERNAIDNAGRLGTPLEGAIGIITRFPCARCAGSLINVGASLIVAPPPVLDHPRWGKSFEVSLESLLEVKIPIILVSEDGIPLDIDPAQILADHRAVGVAA